MSVISKEIFRNIHNEAMDISTFAKLGYNPQCKDRVYTEADRLRDYEKSLAMEKQAIALIQAKYDQTQDDGDKLTESIYSRSAAWTAIQAEKFSEAEKIVLTALSRDAHPAEKEKLYKALFTAISKQGFRYQPEPVEQTQEQEEPELVTV